MTEHTRRPGRPRLTEGDTPARLHVTLSSKDYDRAQSLARREGISVPEIVRRGLTRVLSDARDD